MSRRSKNEPDEFFKLVRILSAVVTHSMEPLLIDRAGGSGISLAQLNILRLISRNGEHALKEIAFFAGISLPAASYIIDRLFEMGLVTRAENSQDRRLLRIGITDRGADLVRKYKAACAEDERAFREIAGPREIAEFNRVVHKFIRHVLSRGKFKRRHCLQCGAFQKGGCVVAEIKGTCDYLPAHAELRK